MPAKVETIDRRRLLRQRFSVWIAFVALAIACVLARQAEGQGGDYVTATMPPEFSDARKLRELETAVRTALTDSSISSGAANWKAAEDYYQKYYLYLAAQPEPGVELTEFTYDALKSLETASRSGSPAFRTAMQGWLRGQAQRIATTEVKGKYFHPAARINATLLLANLDTKPAGGGNPPVPDLMVGPVLGTKLYENKENKEVPTGVRVVALSGLRRHSVLVGTALPEAHRNYYLTKGKELLDGKAPAGLEPENIDPAAFAFMQRYAVDIVRSLGTAEDQKWLAGKLTEIVARKDASPVIALYAARNLAKLNEGVKELPVAAPTVVAWGDRAATALASELKRLKELEKRTPVTPQQSLLTPSTQSAGPMAGGYGGMGGAMGAGNGAMGSDYGAMGGDYGAMGGDYGAMGGGYGAMGEGAMGEAGYGAMGGNYGGGAAAAKPQPPEIIAARRRINANLEALILGLTGSIEPDKGGGGLQAAAKDQAKTELDELMAKLWSTAEAVNDRVLADRTQFVTMLEEQSKDLGDWVKRRQRATGGQPTAAAGQPTNPGVAAR